jgi:hypothetical protein
MYIENFEATAEQGLNPVEAATITGHKEFNFISKTWP